MTKIEGRTFPRFLQRLPQLHVAYIHHLLGSSHSVTINTAQLLTTPKGILAPECDCSHMIVTAWGFVGLHCSSASPSAQSCPHPPFCRYCFLTKTRMLNCLWVGFPVPTQPGIQSFKESDSSKYSCMFFFYKYMYMCIFLIEVFPRWPLYQKI